MEETSRDVPPSARYSTLYSWKRRISLRSACRNAAENGLTNCRFLAGDVLAVLDQIGTPPDALILDPPRAGVHHKALRKLLSYGVPWIVYVSCKPESLADELPAITHAGYQLQKAVCVDMFPWTGNIETVVMLKKQPIGG